MNTYNSVPVYTTTNIQTGSSANNSPIGMVWRQETPDGSVVYYTWTDNRTYPEYVIYYPETPETKINPYPLLQQSPLKYNPEPEEKEQSIQLDKKVEELELFNGEPKRKIRI